MILLENVECICDEKKCFSSGCFPWAFPSIRRGEQRWDWSGARLRAQPLCCRASAPAARGHGLLIISVVLLCCSASGAFPCKTN